MARKKESADRLLYAGFFVMLISSFLDRIGTVIGLWYYPVCVVPLMPSVISYDICILPVVTMLTIQWFPRIRPFIKSLIYAAVGTFIFQPLNKWIGLYQELYWKDYYSFPIFILIYLIANYLSSKNRFAELK